MNQWKNYPHTTVLFVEKYWQIEETMIICISSLRLYFPGQKIDLLFDCALSHLKVLVNWIKAENLNSSTKVFVEFVDECLTSIYQPYDMTVNKLLKEKL